MKYKKANVIDILKNIKDVRLGKTLIVPENYDKVPLYKNTNNNNNNYNEMSNTPKKIIQ